MTETPPDPDPYPWLPVATVAAWIGVDGQGDALEGVRRAAAAYCEQQRPDLTVDVVDDAGVVIGTTWAAEDTHKLAGLIAAGRLWSRKGSPAGLASFGEFGATAILRFDEDVSRLLGVGRNATPRVG